MKETRRVSDTLVAEILAADHILIATPVYNYNVPASLEAWVDHIVRKGMTLDADGRGLVTGKTATVLIASGGICTEGSPMRDRDIDPLPAPDPPGDRHHRRDRGGRRRRDSGRPARDDDGGLHRDAPARDRRRGRLKRRHQAAHARVARA